MFSNFHPSVQEMKTLITYSLCVSCVLFLLVQLPLSCDVIECKLLELHSPDAYAIMTEA